MTPYATGSDWTIYCGNALDLLSSLKPSHVVTDPVWPNVPAKLDWGDPYKLFEAFCSLLPNTVERMAVVLGCVSDPRFLRFVPDRLRFLRVMHLRYALPSRIGRTLINADYAYLFGSAPTPMEGRRIVPGEITVADNRELHEPNFDGGHPCPRRLKHMGFIVEHFCRINDLVLDPFCGSGTTLVACRDRGIKSVGIEINEKYAELAADRLSKNPILIAA